MARTELNDQEVKEVVGGAFTFYVGRKTGKLLCYVDGVGTFEANCEGCQEKVAIMCIENEGLDQASLANLALANGYLIPIA